MRDTEKKKEREREKFRKIPPPQDNSFAKLGQGVSISNSLWRACVLRHFSCVQFYLTLWNVACQPPLSMVILQARIPEWVAMWDFPGGSDGKASVYNAGDLGSIPGSGRSAGEGNGKLQYYCLESPVDRGVW